MSTDNHKLCECDLMKENQTGFNDWNDFYNFKNQVESNKIFKQIFGEISLDGEEPVVDNEIQGWFQCKKCFSKWCLHMPDPPFDGSWVKATWRK